MPKLFTGWSVVGATAVALMVSGTTFAAATFGLLTAYAGRSFGWDQSAMSVGLSIFLLSATAAVPFVGRLTDRFGSRRVALCGTFAMAAAVASGALMQGSVFTLYGFYVAVGVTGAFTNPVAYMRAITLWFDRKRGLAVGLAVAGQGAGGALLPVLIQGLAAHFGWRSALLIIAGIMVLVITPVIALFIKDDPADFGEVPDGDRNQPETRPNGVLPGLTMAEALRRPVFWLILGVLGLCGLTTYALAGHTIFLLTHGQGLTLGQAAILQAIGGLSLLIGRVIFGWLMDRWPISIVGAFGVILAAVGTTMLLSVHGFGPMAFVRSIMIGAAGGAETDLLTLLVGRYFGKKALAEIYSWHNVAFLVGAAAGPPLFGVVLAVSGGIAIPVYAVVGATVLTAMLLLYLGLYPQFSPEEPQHQEDATSLAAVV